MAGIAREAREIFRAVGAPAAPFNPNAHAP